MSLLGIRCLMFNTTLRHTNPCWLFDTAVGMCLAVYTNVQHASAEFASDEPNPGTHHNLPPLRQCYGHADFTDSTIVGRRTCRCDTCGSRTTVQWRKAGISYGYMRNFFTAGKGATKTKDYLRITVGRLILKAISVTNAG